MPRPPLAPSERWLLAQTLFSVTLAAWALGGRASWAPAAIAGAVSLSVLPVWLAHRERRIGAMDRFAAGPGAPGALDSASGGGRALTANAGQRLVALGCELKAFAPLLLFLGYVGLSLWNPSHVQVPGGGWFPREGWIGWLPTVVDRSLAVPALLPWAAALAQGGAIAFVLRSRRAVRLLSLGLVAGVLLLAVVGSAVWFAGSKKILGFHALPAGTPFATFIYRNHWVAFALLGAAGAAGEAFAAWDRAGDGPRDGDLRLFAFCALLLLLCALCLPGSRSGALLAIFLAGVVAVAALRRIWRSGNPLRSRPLLAAAVGAFVLLAIGVALRQAWTPLEDELARVRREWIEARDHGQWNQRVYVYRDTLRLIEARPWFGWGAGSFVAVFPIYQGDYDRDPKGRIEHPWDRAHCDWLQVAAEFGLVGLAFFVVTLGFALRRIFRTGGTRSSWALLGCGMVAVYALVDFPFQNPAVLLLWTVMFATAGCAGRKKMGNDWEADSARATATLA